MLALLLPACSKIKHDPNSREYVKSQINAQIPARMVSYLDFELRTVSNGIRDVEVDVIAPVGWRSSVPDDRYMAWLRPPSYSRLRPSNTFAFSVNCAGDCVAKDFAPIIDRELRTEVPDDGLLGDEMLPDGGRVRWGVTSRGANALAAWAVPGDTSYRRCLVRLTDPNAIDASVVDAIKNFVDACKTARFRSPDPASATPQSETE